MGWGVPMLLEGKRTSPSLSRTDAIFVLFLCIRHVDVSSEVRAVKRVDQDLERHFYRPERPSYEVDIFRCFLVKSHVRCRAP